MGLFERLGRLLQTVLTLTVELRHLHETIGTLRTEFSAFRTDTEARLRSLEQAVATLQQGQETIRAEVRAAEAEMRQEQLQFVAQLQAARLRQLEAETDTE
jgi:hypothetical protein